MKDELEKFVIENRNDFDDLEPSKDLWGGIENNLSSSSRNTRSWQWLWKAASLIFFISTVYLLYKLEESGMSTNQIATIENNKDTAAYNEDFKDVESFYFQQISEKRDLIYDFESKDFNVDSDFEADLQKLDAMYLVLKEEMSKNPSKEVVDALILNLLVRVGILNKELEKLEDTSLKKEKEHEVNA